MKILSNKKMEEIKQELTNYELDKSEWEKDEQSYLRQIKILSEKIQDIKKENEDNANMLIKFEYDEKDYKKEIKRLKTLLTKNNVNYKKEDKSNE